AEALGEFNGNGDVSIFVNKMNQKANELGLTTLRYCTPHGLPPEDTQGKCRDQGSAADLYRLAQTVIKYDDYLNISKNSSGYIDNGNIKLTSTNNLLEKVEGVDGLKTGYYRAAGSNIILTAKRGEKRIILIIMGSEKAKNRDLIGQIMIDDFFATHHDVKVIDSTIAIGSVKIKSTKYNLYPEKDIITNDGVSTSVINKDATFIFNLSDNIKTAKTEDIVGTYTAKYNGKEFTGNLILR
ncbi:MAG: D-alanyl-D-alanine carboxypeptidase, partial [Leptotrichiaceae bacterium]